MTHFCHYNSYNFAQCWGNVHVQQVVTIWQHYLIMTILFLNVTLIKIQLWSSDKHNHLMSQRCLHCVCVQHLVLSALQTERVVGNWAKATVKYWDIYETHLWYKEAHGMRSRMVQWAGKMKTKENKHPWCLWARHQIPTAALQRALTSDLWPHCAEGQVNLSCYIIYYKRTVTVIKIQISTSYWFTEQTGVWWFFCSLPKGKDQ